MTRRSLRRVLLAVALLWLLPLGWYDYSFTAGEKGDYQKRLTIGLSASPWFTSREGRAHASFQMTFHSEQRIEFLSWSALCFAISLLCFMVAGRLKTAPAPAIDKPRETSP